MFLLKAIFGFYKALEFKNTFYQLLVLKILLSNVLSSYVSVHQSLLIIFFLIIVNIQSTLPRDETPGASIDKMIFCENKGKFQNKN